MHIARLELLTASVIAACLFFTLGCEPDDVPRYAPDGKSVLAMISTGEVDEMMPVVVAIDSGQVTELALPKEWSALGSQWSGDRVLVRAKVETKKEVAYWLLDPKQRQQPRRLLANVSPASSFQGVFKGEPCIFLGATSGNEGEFATLVLSRNDLSQVASLPYQVNHAGHGCLTRTQMRIANEAAGTKEIVSLQVIDENLELIGEISREEIGKACFRGPRVPQCVRVSRDKKQILLGFDTSTIFRRHTHDYTFGVFALPGGQLLWSGNSNALCGSPVFRNGVIYALEAKSKDSTTIEFAGRSPGMPVGNVVLAAHAKSGRKVVLEIPMDGETATRYSASPNGESFVLQTEGEKPTLMLIPIRDRVGAQEVKRIAVHKK